MERNEVVNAAQLTADGVWSIPEPSCSTCSLPDPIDYTIVGANPNVIWPTALKNLNAVAWSVAEGAFNDWINYPVRNPPTTIRDVNSYSLTQAFLQAVGLPPLKASFVYHECSPPNSPCNYGYGTNSSTMLLPAEINASANALGVSIVVLSRAYDYQPERD
jgi:hypothetical protein